MFSSEIQLHSNYPELKFYGIKYMTLRNLNFYESENIITYENGYYTAIKICNEINQVYYYNPYGKQPPEEIINWVFHMDYFLIGIDNPPLKYEVINTMRYCILFFQTILKKSDILNFIQLN